MKKQKVLIILGPTASGKSDLAVKLALKFNGEIISADSRQVYKGLDAGTGKISKKERLGIPHHLLDIIDPKEYFSASDYKKLGDEALRHVVAKQKLPIVCGGTGFYIDTLIGKINLPEVPPNKLLRKRLEKYNTEKLYKILEKKDPKRAKQIDPRNKVRIIRALEVIDTLGHIPLLKPLINKDYEFIFVGLKPDQKDLENKIYKRILKRLSSMIKEAKKLRLNKLPYTRMEALGLEYRYLARLLQKKITKQEFMEQLFSEIKKYSKRQMTWFKKNSKIKWFKPKQYKTIEKYLKTKL